MTYEDKLEELREQYKVATVGKREIILLQVRALKIAMELQKTEQLKTDIV